MFFFLFIFDEWISELCLYVPCPPPHLHHVLLFSIFLKEPADNSMSGKLGLTQGSRFAGRILVYRMEEREGLTRPNMSIKMKGGVTCT